MRINRAIAVIGFLFFGMSQCANATCETDFATNVNDFTTLCGAGNYCGSGGYLRVLKLTPHYASGYTSLRMECRQYNCSGESMGAPTVSNATFCSSQYNSGARPQMSRVLQPTLACGSIVQVENQVVGESIPLTGNGFSLNYFSNWVEGRASEYTFSIPLAGSTPRDNINSFDVSVDFGGTIIQSVNYVNNQSNLTHTYTWDGKDLSGNPTMGSRKFIITVTENRPSLQIPVTTTINLGSFKSRLLGLGGWIPSILNFYDSESKTLFKGDGSTRNVTSVPWNTTGHMIAEEDGTLVYYFDSTGRQIYTKTGVTGTTIYTFSYDSNGLLSSIGQPFSRTTVFNRNGSGDLISITAPKGQVTTATLDSNGYLSSLTNPQSETYAMAYYGTKGLLYTFTKPATQVSTFTYDSLGNLTRDAHSGGYFFDLVKNGDPNGVIDYSKVSKMGRQATHTGTYSETSTSKYISRPNLSTEYYSFSSSNPNWTLTTNASGIYKSMSGSYESRFGYTSGYPTGRNFRKLWIA